MANGWLTLPPRECQSAKGPFGAVCHRCQTAHSARMPDCSPRTDGEQLDAPVLVLNGKRLANVTPEGVPVRKRPIRRRLPAVPDCSLRTDARLLPPHRWRTTRCARPGFEWQTAG